MSGWQRPIRALATRMGRYGMKVNYISLGGAGPAYEIEADRHGNYTIRNGGAVVKRVTSITRYVGRPRWGSRKLELSAIEEAKAVIEAHHAQG